MTVLAAVPADIPLPPAPNRTFGGPVLIIVGALMWYAGLIWLGTKISAFERWDNWLRVLPLLMFLEGVMSIGYLRAVVQFPLNFLNEQLQTQGSEFWRTQGSTVILAILALIGVLLIVRAPAMPARRRGLMIIAALITWPVLTLPYVGDIAAQITYYLNVLPMGFLAQATLALGPTTGP
jgi:hypothetical protein